MQRFTVVTVLQSTINKQLQNSSEHEQLRAAQSSLEQLRAGLSCSYNLITGLSDLGGSTPAPRNTYFWPKTARLIFHFKKTTENTSKNPFTDREIGDLGR